MFEYDTIKEQLKTGSYIVNFTKSDGTHRRLLCTLQPDFLPGYRGHELTNETSDQSQERLSVWDIENKGWRSFRIDSIISIRPEHESIS